MNRQYPVLPLRLAVGGLRAALCAAGLLVGWQEFRDPAPNDTPLSAIVSLSGILGGSALLFAAYVGGSGDVPRVVLVGTSLVGVLLALPMLWIMAMYVEAFFT